MDVRQQLVTILNVDFTHQLAAEAAHNRSLFDELFALCSDNEKRAAWRAAWVIEKVALKNAESFNNQDVERIIEMTLNTPYEGVRRSCLTMLLHFPQITEVNIDLLNACYNWLLSPKQPIAIQALSLKLVHRFCSFEPELLNELRVVVENIDQEMYSKGMKSVLRKMHKLLN